MPGNEDVGASLSKKIKGFCTFVQIIGGKGMAGRR
jgi:hypothetical protein